MPTKKPITPGDVFWKLTILRQVEPRNGRRRAECRCECGRIKPIAISLIVAGHIRSCGCGSRQGRPKNDAVLTPAHIQRRLDSLTNRSESCWLWTGHLNSKGYPSLRVLGRTSHAHRIAYELAYGPIPEGMNVCHRCDVRHCVRPDHMFLGTQADNLADMVAKGRQPKHWKLTKEQVAEIRRLYSMPNHRNKARLAAAFGVTATAIRRIVRHD